MKRLRAITRPLRFLFVFKKPVFIQMDYVDLVVDNRPLFVVCWYATSLYKLKIKPVKRSFFKKQGSFILQIPKETDVVEIIASNFWRRTNLIVPLKHIELDDKTSSLLIQKFKPLKTLEIKRAPLFLAGTKAVHPTFHIQPKQFQIHTRKTISVKIQNLKYP